MNEQLDQQFKETFDRLESTWAKDAKLDQSDLAVESLNIPNLHHKYHKMFTANRAVLARLNGQYKQLVHNKQQYYMGLLDKATLDELGWAPWPLKIIRQDLQSYIDADKDIINLSLKIDYMKEILAFLVSIIDQINKRTFHIKNAIEFMKWTQGAG